MRNWASRSVNHIHITLLRAAGFTASREKGGNRLVYVSELSSSGEEGRHFLLLVWAWRSHLLHSSCGDPYNKPEEDGNRRSCPLTLEELWKARRRPNPLPVDDSLLPVWARHQSHKHSEQGNDCKQWISRFSLPWADVEPWNIYSHVGAAVW